MADQLKVERSSRKSALPAVSVFDRKILAYHTMNDPALADEIIKLFLVQLKRFEVEDWADFDLNHEMHSLRGSAAAVGAKELEEIAETWRKLGADLEARTKAAIADFRVAALR